MLPQLVTIPVKQGDTLTLACTLTQDDSTTPIDLTGGSIEWSTANARLGQKFWTYTDEPGIAEITDAANGKIMLTLAPALSRAWEATEVVQTEVTITLPSGVRVTVLDGAFAVRLEVVNEQANP